MNTELWDAAVNCHVFSMLAVDYDNNDNNNNSFLVRQPEVE